MLGILTAKCRISNIFLGYELLVVYELFQSTGVVCRRNVFFFSVQRVCFQLDLSFEYIFFFAAVFTFYSTFIHLFFPPNKKINKSELGSLNTVTKSYAALNKVEKMRIQIKKLTRKRIEKRALVLVK